MWAVLKVYASGGENELHAHPQEDHAFIVLQGRAAFFGPNDEAVTLQPVEDCLHPRRRLRVPRPGIVEERGGVGDKSGHRHGA